MTAGCHLATDCAVAAEDVVKSYGAASSAVFALRGVSLQVRRGERVALLGKSGSGKSTLLHLIGGLDRPTSGSIRAGERDLAGMRADELAAYRLTTVGMIFQAYNLVASRTALENVELPMILAGRPAGERRAAARDALAAVGLAERFRHRPTELSGGEHQRVAIARALVNRPEILLADEPTGNLDSATAVEIMSMLLALLVAAIGITNTMIMSVLERAHEIGIMKALGARDRDVRRIFLVEGVLIGFLGSGLGLILGWLASFPGDAIARRIVETHKEMPLKGTLFIYPVWLVIGIPALVCLITTLAALYPASRAARVDPVTSLRHE